MEWNAAIATQSQAMNALAFLYKQVLKHLLDARIDAIFAGRNRRIPVVLSLLLVVKLLYGSGLRITESVRLRVQDMDFAYKQITARSGKGNKELVTTFSVSLIPFLQNHLAKVKLMHERR